MEKWCYVQVEIPAEYDIVEKETLKPYGGKKVKEQVLRKEASVMLIATLCPADLTKRRLKKIRNALRKRGFEMNDAASLAADDLLLTLKAFQKEEHLNSGFYSLETMNALGVKFKKLSAKRGKG